MSPDDLETIRSGYEAISRRDVDAWLEGFQPDAELHELPGAPDAGVYRGHDELRRWAESQLEVFPQWQWTTEVLHATSNTALVRARLTATSASGVPGDLWVFHVIEVRDGKATRVRGFLDEAEALEAVGLRE